MNSKNQTLFLIAGEASGDLHTSGMVRELKKLAPEFKLVGLGGPRMEEAGVEIIFDLTKISALGFLEVILKYFQFRKVFYQALKKVKELKPAAVILTDFPGFNLRFAKKVKQLGIPVIYYVSPQVWAWKKGRIHSIPKIVDKMLLILPFEKDIYKDPQMEVEFVGHPLTQVVKPTKTKEEIIEDFGLDRNKKILSIVPGSRKHELKRILPIMAEAAAQLQKTVGPIHFLVTKAPFLPLESYEKVLKDFEFPYQIIDGHLYDCLSISDFAMVKSGTSTLEATILGTPYVLVYKISPLTYWIGKCLVKIPFLGMANIIAGKLIVPEFIQAGAKPDKISPLIQEILGDTKRLEEMKEALRKVREEIETSNPSEKAAKSVLQYLTK